MCGIVGLLVKKPALRERLGELDAADAHRHDRARAGFGGPGGVHRARRGRAAQVQPVCTAARGFDWHRVRSRGATAHSAPATTLDGAGNHAMLETRGRARAGEGAGSRSAYPRLHLLSVGRLDRSLQGHRSAGATSPNRYDFRAAQGHAPGRAHAHGHRVGGDARARASVHGRARTGASSTTARSRTRTASGASSSRSASRSRPTTTPRRRAASSSGACARATISRRALHAGFDELDGFYTFLMGTHDKLALVRDAFACKPAVVAETDDYVAISSEFRSLAAAARTSRTRSSSSRSPRRSTHGSVCSAAAAHDRRHVRSRAAARARAEPVPAPRAARGDAARHACSNPDGAHSIAVGVDAPVDIEIDGHAGYYAGGHEQAGDASRSHGNAGPGVAENMMSGRVRREGLRVGRGGRRGARRAARDRRRRVACAAASR